jgi:hypothetical protein
MELISWLAVILSMSLVAGLPLVSRATDRALSFLDSKMDDKAVHKSVTTQVSLNG